jgi:sortase A
MNPNNGGQSSSDLQRKTAAYLARQKVLAAYSASAKKQQAAAAQSAKPVAQPSHPVQNVAQPKAQAPQPTSASHYKNTGVSQPLTMDAWKKYHSAWQEYYQKYYSEYYSNAAKNYVARERLRDEREKAEDEEIMRVINKNGSKTPIPEDDSIRSELRQKIRAKAATSMKKSRRMRRFIPIFAGVAVVLLILFLQYNRLIFAPIMAYVSPGNVPASQIDALDPTITKTVSADPRLIIPKLNVDVPVHFGISMSEVYNAMMNGVAHYRIAGASSYPGQVGNIVITGHSAGDVYSSNQYKYIFSGLERLETGDLIYVNYNSVRYTYSVTKKEVVEPSNVAALRVSTDKPILTLITCTPLGTSRYRLLVFADQISPNKDDAKEADTDVITVDSGDSIEMPANEPGFFESIWNFLTGN